MAIKHMHLFCMAALVLLMTGCNAAQQRGMLGSAYVSTTRPAISVEAKNMPLLTAGQGSTNLTWSGMMGGLPIRVWLAVYGTGDISPMAVVAQAEVPQGWYWDSIMRRPFSVDEGVEVFDGVGYQACTYIVDSSHDPFGALVAGKTTTGQPVRWLARGFAARYNFNDDKIIMEYREPLPAGIESLSVLPLGTADTLRAFEQRARETFSVGPVPSNLSQLRQGYAQGVQWQYMDENFLGTVSKYDFFNGN